MCSITVTSVSCFCNVEIKPKRVIFFYVCMCGGGRVGLPMWHSWWRTHQCEWLANAGDVRDMNMIPGSGRSPGGDHGNSLQYFCLENSVNWGAWWASVHGVAESQIQPKQLGMHAPTCICVYIYLAARVLSCNMWDLVPQPGIKPGLPALGAQSLSHWNTREVPREGYF